MCLPWLLYPLSHYVSLKHLSPTHKNFIVSLNTTIIPNTISEALKKREWKDAMREVMSALEKNKTWEIVERPKGKNIVDCKWIFTLKYKADGSLERHKTRLVAKGYSNLWSWLSGDFCSSCKNEYCKNPAVTGCPLQLATPTVWC